MYKSSLYEIGYISKKLFYNYGSGRKNTIGYKKICMYKISEGDGKLDLF